MYFNNRQTASENENILANAVRRSRTFDEHQSTTAMFLTVLVSNANQSDARGWTQNVLRGYQGPDHRYTSQGIQDICDAAKRTLEGCGPQTAVGNAIILLDEKLAEDPRFAGIPVGSAVLFKGILDNKFWDIKCETASHLAIPGYFVSPTEFVVHNPELAGSYLQGVTRWHGGEDKVGFLRQKNEPLKLMNRRLDETHALAEIYYGDDPDKSATVWLKRGMRLELRPYMSSLSRILTSPEDTQPHATNAVSIGKRALFEQMMGSILHEITIAWNMTDLPLNTHDFSQYKNGFKGAGDALKSVLAFNPALYVGDVPALRASLQAHGCDITGTLKLVGRDGRVTNLNDLISRHGYYYSRVDVLVPNAHYHERHIKQHYQLLLAIAAFVHANDLPHSMTLALFIPLVFSHTSRNSNLGEAFLLKLKSLLSTPHFDILGTINEVQDDVDGGLTANVFLEQRIARTRATYHDKLSTSKRKKVLAKFYPAV